MISTNQKDDEIRCSLLNSFNILAIDKERLKAIERLM
jgi:hypothetical protein